LSTQGYNDSAIHTKSFASLTAITCRLKQFVWLSKNMREVLSSVESDVSDFG
jgi:hypothetical protein